ncbi:hypothetical protein EVAR_92516_1 [Eumeta japonica]|uniref:Uncharacterized protein n=1 Tax=Eumeta variegata TaxID=151549 RepID=A0A4C1T677_EUMVA|nr:hypothetical protein EVAR_92516_1 [Eumeta japonica]
MIKFRYKRKEAAAESPPKPQPPPQAQAQQKSSGTAIQKQKIEALRDRELLPPKDMLVMGNRHNTLPRVHRGPAPPPPVLHHELVPQTTLALFRSTGVAGLPPPPAPAAAIR